MRIASALAAASLGAVARSQQDVYIEAFSSLLVYLPDKGSWWPNRNPQPGPNGTSVENYYHAGECQSSLVLGASVSLTFVGSYIAYYGDLHQSHGEMEINLDGNITRLTTHTPLPYGTPQVKLFEAHVDPDMPAHTIKLTNLEDNKYTSLDYFLYTPVSSVISEPPPPAAAPTADTRNPTTTLPQSLRANGSATMPPTHTPTPPAGSSSSETAENTTLRHKPRSLSTLTVVLISAVSILSLLLFLLAGAFYQRSRRSGKTPTDQLLSLAGLPRPFLLQRSSLREVRRGKSSVETSSLAAPPYTL